MDRRKITAPINGKNGGRPVGSKTLETQLQRAMLVEWIKPHLSDMFEAQRQKALDGDTQAFVALLDRAWGKPAQALTGADGKDLFPSTEEKAFANEAIESYLVSK